MDDTMDDTADEQHPDHDIEHGDSDSSDAGSVTEAKVKGWIQEAIEGLDILKDVPGEGMVDPEPDEPVTIKAVEAAARRAVEDAMAPLRQAAEKKKPAAKKAAPKADPKPEPEPSPAKGSPNRLRRLMWGDPE